MAGREGREGAVIADNFRVDLLECVDQGQHYLIVKAIDCSFHEAKFNQKIAPSWTAGTLPRQPHVMNIYSTATRLN